MIPLLLRPQLLAVKNRWKGGIDLRTHFGRDIVIAIFSIIITVSIYYGCSTALDKIKASTNLAYFPPALPLAAVLLVLFGMLILSNTVGAVSAFFLGRDIDLVLSSPLSPWRFFTGKLSDVLFGTSWMAILFGAPALIAFGRAYDAPLSFYALALAVFIPYFIIPGLIALIVVTLAARFIPAKRTKELLCIFIIIGTGLVFYAIKLALPSDPSGTSETDILYVISLVQAPTNTFLPSYWAAVTLGETLSGTGKPILPYLLMLYGTSGALTSLAFILVRLLHLDAYSLAKNSKNTIAILSASTRKIALALFPQCRSEYRGIIGKDLKSFARDISHTVQLVLLFGLCIIYLYNFKVMHNIHGLPEQAQLWWRTFLIIANLVLGAFVITAASSRFVFPSLSLEGQSFWVIQSAPVNLSDLLRAKFWCFFIPVASIGSIIFGLGAFAINGGIKLAIVNACVSWIMAYGIVGLAVGFGAMFAHFDWDHPGQLAASFGSLVFMLTSTVLICVSMIPASVPVLIRTVSGSGIELSTVQWYAVLLLSTTLLIWINYKAATWALQVGENALRERFS